MPQNTKQSKQKGAQHNLSVVTALRHCRSDASPRIHSISKQQCYRSLGEGKYCSLQTGLPSLTALPRECRWLIVKGKSLGDNKSFKKKVEKLKVEKGCRGMKRWVCVFGFGGVRGSRSLLCDLSVRLSVGLCQKNENILREKDKNKQKEGKYKKLTKQ